jgi:hypothetical protein
MALWIVVEIFTKHVIVFSSGSTYHFEPDSDLRIFFRLSLVPFLPPLCQTRSSFLDSQAVEKSQFSAMMPLSLLAQIMVCSYAPVEGCICIAVRSCSHHGYHLFESRSVSSSTVMCGRRRSQMWRSQIWLNFLEKPTTVALRIVLEMLIEGPGILQKFPSAIYKIFVDCCKFL